MEVTGGGVDTLVRKFVIIICPKSVTFSLSHDTVPVGRDLLGVFAVHGLPVRKEDALFGKERVDDFLSSSVPKDTERL